MFVTMLKCRSLKGQLLQYTNRSAHAATTAQKVCKLHRSITVSVSEKSMEVKHHNFAAIVKAQSIAERAGIVHVVQG